MKPTSEELPEATKKLREKTRQTIYNVMHPKSAGAGSAYFATHVGKFTNPSVSWRVAWCDEQEKDLDSPYVSYASVQTDIIDGISNSAANLPAIRLLCSSPKRLWGVGDDVPMRQHLLQDDAFAREIFAPFPDVSYDVIRNKMLEFTPCPPPSETSNHMRQIFFPVMREGKMEDHILTVLPSSVLMSEMNRRNRTMNMLIKEQKEQGEAYEFLPGHRVEVKFGGSKPQNISLLASFEGGTFETFASTVPSLKQGTAYPRSSFFIHCFYYKGLRQNFLDMFKAFSLKVGDGNIHKRHYFEAIRDSIIDAFIEEAYRIRSLPGGWVEEKQASLPSHQMRFLDASHVDEFSDADFDALCEDAENLRMWCIRHLTKAEMEGISLADWKNADFAKPFRDEFSRLFPRKGD